MIVVKCSSHGWIWTGINLQHIRELWDSILHMRKSIQDIPVGILTRANKFLFIISALLCGSISLQTFQPEHSYFSKSRNHVLNTCLVTTERYYGILQAVVNPKIQRWGCLGTATFLQYDVIPHIRLEVQKLLRRHFTRDRIINFV